MQDDSANFDFETFARRHGIERRHRTVRLAEMFGISAAQMRRILRGGTPPSRTMMIAAEALDRVLELEREVREQRALRLEQSLDRLWGLADGGLTTTEILAERRPENA